MAKGCWGPNRIGEPVDRKFMINAACREHGDSVDENHAIVFLAKDAALPTTLVAYRLEAERLGADARQLEAIQLLMERVRRYQEAHRDRVKVPDVEAGVAGDQIVAPNR